MVEHEIPIRQQLKTMHKNTKLRSKENGVESLDKNIVTYAVHPFHPLFT